VLEDERLETVVQAAVRQGLDLPRQRRPLIEVQITRLSAETLDGLEDERERAA
jgi:ribonuclease J